jgi:hypothetical protein
LPPIDVHWQTGERTAAWDVLWRHVFTLRQLRDAVSTPCAAGGTDLNVVDARCTQITALPHNADD